MDVKELTSARTILDEFEDTISSDLGVITSTISAEEKSKLLEELKKKIVPIKRQRGVVKRKITLLFKNICDVSGEDYSSSTVSSLLEEIALRQEEIRHFDSEIEAIICASGLIEHDQTLLNEEVIGASHYHLKNQILLSKVRPIDVAGSNRSSSSAHSNEDAVSRAEVHSILKNYTPQQEVKIPPLKCKSFSGEGDRLQFRSFLLSFENIFGCRKDISDAAKLQYLKAHLTGYALRDIEHFPNVNENYQVALKTLKDLYLDVPFIVDSLFHKIDSAIAIDNKNVEDVRHFLSEVRANLYELKEFGVDFFDENSAGCKFLSHVVVDKLPLVFLRELRIESKEEYPSIVTILSKYQQILKTLEKMRGKPYFQEKEKKKQSSPILKKKSSSFNTTAKTSRRESSKSPKGDKKSKEHISGSAVSSVVDCKLCGSNHYMSSCSTYPSSSARRERCVELGMCTSCSSSKHPTKQCPAKRYGLSRPCFLCRSGAHISALCPTGAMSKEKSRSLTTGAEAQSSSASALPTQLDEVETHQNHLCINTGASVSNSILPTMALKVKKGNKIVKIRVLLDLGSQRSYFNSSILSKLGVDIHSLSSSTNTIKTFLGEQDRTMHPIDLELNICCDSFTKISVFIDPNLDVGFDVRGLMGAIQQAKYNGYKIADDFYCGRHGDQVRNIEGLLGIDSLYLMKHFRVVNCLGGSAVDSCHGYIPFGPAKTFLTPSQIETIFEETTNDSQSSSGAF